MCVCVLQISLYGGSWELGCACAALVTGCDVPLEEQGAREVWRDVPDEGVARAPPLLALLPVSLHEPPLAAALAALARTIVAKVPPCRPCHVPSV